MSNGDAGQSVESAIEATEDHITKNLKKCTAEGLGWALHAEQDKHAAGHRGYQPWYVHSKKFKHWSRDAFGGGQDDAIAASVRLIKRFKEMCPCACGE